LTKAAIMTGKISVLPDFLASCPTLSRLTPSLVNKDQLLCLPDPFAPWMKAEDSNRERERDRERECKSDAVGLSLEVSSARNR
jgi:hypothetical protein